MTYCASEKTRARDRARYAANPEKKKIANKKWRANNPAQAREMDNKKHRRQRREHPEKYRAKTLVHNMRRYHRRRKEEPEALKLERYGYRLKARYKVNGQPMTMEDYEAFSVKQQGHCALCPRTHAQERYGRLSVDHDYATGEVRGLLCATHNTSLGSFGDNEAGVLRLLAYVRGEL